MSADPEDDAGGSEEAVRVFVRIRPLNKRELAAKQTIGWNFNDTSMLQDTQNGQRVYAFDRCFHPDGNNTEVYERVGKPVVLKALEGFNGTVFTYGQTGSGKTFTMRGNDEDPGMMILCIRDIFDYIAASTKRTFELRVSYMEVYNEEINDLLGSGPNSKNLRIVSEDAVKGAVIGGLTEELVGNPDELMEVLARGESSRSYGSTEMNAESSRSHTIYRLAITSKEVDEPSEGGDIDAGGAMYVPAAGGGTAAGRLSFMNLVDLAGSERQKSTGASGKTLKEGSNINKSLLSLGAVISKLGEASKKPAKGAKPVFIPYRDSKLTRILKQSLGGNTLTSILCTVTPAPMHIEETVSTLKFGQLCKTIKNNVKNNEVVDDRALIKMYKNLVAELRAQLVDAESNRGRTSSILSGGGIGDPYSEEGDEVDGKASRELRNELTKSKKENEELRVTVQSLKESVKEVEELEALKISLDDYQKESQTAIEEERAKMEDEKEALQKQRAMMLAEKTQLNEKEGRLGTLLGMLDERESTLRQHLSALNEQQAHWQQSVDALRHREEQVEEWNRAHAERQKSIDEASAEVSRQREELESREAVVSETENQLETDRKEITERDFALLAQKNRLADVEIACTALQDKLNAEQAAINGRVAYLDSKEKEYADKLREQEIMDSLLRDREKQIENDRKIIDEKLEMARATEEKHRIREAELDKKSNSIRLKESEAVLMAERHARLLADLEVREAQCLKDANRQTENERMLNEQEARLFELQDQLSVKEQTLAAVEDREKELQLRIDAHAKIEEDFYNVKVAMISSRHAAELVELEGLVTEQLKISSNFQEEIEKTRADLKDAIKEKAALESLSSSRGLLIEKLQLEMAALNAERRQLSAAEYQSSISDIPNFGLSSAMPGPSNQPGSQSSNAMDGGENESDESKNRATLTPEATSAQAFLNQLGATQRMLCKILDSHKLDKVKKEKTGHDGRPTMRSKAKQEAPEIDQKVVKKKAAHVDKHSRVVTVPIRDGVAGQIYSSKHADEQDFNGISPSDKDPLRLAFSEKPKHTEISQLTNESAAGTETDTDAGGNLSRVNGSSERKKENKVDVVGSSQVYSGGKSANQPLSLFGDVVDNTPSSIQSKISHTPIVQSSRFSDYNSSPLTTAHFQQMQETRSERAISIQPPPPPRFLSSPLENHGSDSNVAYPIKNEKNEILLNKEYRARSDHASRNDSRYAASPTTNNGDTGLGSERYQTDLSYSNLSNNKSAGANFKSSRSSPSGRIQLRSSGTINSSSPPSSSNGNVPIASVKLALQRNHR